MNSKYKNILTKEFLIEEYIINNKSLLQISKDIKICYSAVRTYVIKNNIIKSKVNKKYYCINCNKEIHRRSIRCKECFIKWFKGKNHSKFKDGRSLEVHYCIKRCGEKVSSKGNRCRKCASKEISFLIKNNKSLKGKNNGRYIDGRSSQILYCAFINCNKQITKNSKSGYCHSHEAKNRLKNLFIHPLYKGKEALHRKIYYCIRGCGEKVYWQTAIYKGGKCKKCGIKERKNFNGKNNPNWKGGKQSLKGLIKNLDKYKFWRTTIFKRNNYVCQKCNQVGGKLHVHHINSFIIIFREFLFTYSQFSPIEDKETLVRLAESYEPFWDINNGVTLCIECHKLTDNFLKKEIKRI